MNDSPAIVVRDYLPFYITGPGEFDILFAAVAIALIAIVVGFGALYFTIQAIPDRLAKGTSKSQMQLVGLLGLISLFTLNNLYWIAAILLAAIRIPDFVTPLMDIARSLRSRTGRETKARDEKPGEPFEPADVSSDQVRADEAPAGPSADLKATGDD